MFEIYDPSVDIDVDTDENSASSGDEDREPGEITQDKAAEPQRKGSDQRVYEDSAVDENLAEKVDELLKNS